MLGWPRHVAFSVFLAGTIHNIIREWAPGKWLLSYLFSHSAPHRSSCTLASALCLSVHDFLLVHFLATRGPQHLFEYSPSPLTTPGCLDTYLALSPVQAPPAGGGGPCLSCVVENRRLERRQGGEVARERRDRVSSQHLLPCVEVARMTKWEREKKGGRDRP